MTIDNAALRQFILQHFSDEELLTLCFDYFPDAYADFGSGMSLNSKAINLIAHCDRRSRRDDLHAALERERPETWRRSFGALPVETGRLPVSTPTTPIRDQRQVFISHATANATFAHQLAADLRAEGWSVWIAPESILPGEKWAEAIDRGLETSGVFVVALTPEAVASRWVRTETYAAIALEHKGQMRFLPLDVAESDTPALWSGYQYVNFLASYEVGLDGLLRWLDSTGPLLNPPPKEDGSIILAPPPRSPIIEKSIKEEQWRQLQALAHEIAVLLEQQSGKDEVRAVYRQFNRAFGLKAYKKLPHRRFDEALLFLTTWRDEAIAAKPPPELPAMLVETDRQFAFTETVPMETGRQTILTSPPDHRFHEQAGIELIRIPAGQFLYGSADKQKWAQRNEKPQRTINLPEYWIGRAPVTNAQYKHFLDANLDHRVPYVGADWAGAYNWDEERRTYPADKADHPVVLVSWDDARSFCDWAGLALPTEEQWEKAARGTDGRIWPWGNERPTAKHCNFNSNVGGTTPVGAYSPKGDSPRGCADMAGNVWEWIDSYYAKDEHLAWRGGAWNSNGQNTRAAYQTGSDPYDKNNLVGFRVVGLSIEGENLSKEPQYPEIDATVEAPSTVTPAIDGHDINDTDKGNDNRDLIQNEAVNDPDRLAILPNIHIAPKSIVGAVLDSYIRIHEKTGIELVRIPAGPFFYGSDYRVPIAAFWGQHGKVAIKKFLFGSADGDPLAHDNEKPKRIIDLPEYWIGLTPITNAQYKRFLDANPNHRVPLNWDTMSRDYSANKADHPVIQVSWQDTKAFCDWAGLALPTEEQWEKAARGTDGRIWPWGNEPPTAEHCNFNANVGDTTPVGQYSPKGDSPYGCADMAGNVWEWTASWYDKTLGGRVLRGGSWYYNQELVRVSIRVNYTPNLADYNIGFRPVAPVVSGS